MEEEECGEQQSIPHCLVCSGLLTEEERRENLSGSYSKTGMSRVATLELLTSVLQLLVLPASQSICRRCFNLLDTLDTLAVQIKLKQSEIINLYENRNIEVGLELVANSDQVVAVDTYCAEPSPDVESHASLNSILSVEKRSVGTTPDEVQQPPKLKERGGFLSADDLKCQLCLKVFDKRRYLMDHLRRVHHSAIHRCKACREKFKLKEDLLNHQNVCQTFMSSKQIVPETSIDVQNKKLFTKRKKNNQCTLCEQYFLTQSLLQTHIKTVHEGEKTDETQVFDETKVENPVVCSLCNITINNEYALSIHQGSVHGFERPWLCNICGKNFARHLELMNHKRTHTGEKPFQCHFCGARFNQKQNLHTHVRHIHLNERKYNCEVCNMKFRRKRLLDCHINSKHKHERPYKCRLCPSTFIYPEHVRKHEQTHSEKKKYQCDQCDKSFRSKASLDNHGSSHRPPTNYQCLSCPLFFLSKEDLLHHLKTSNHPKGVFSCPAEPVAPLHLEAGPGPGLEQVVLYLAAGEAGQVFLQQPPAPHQHTHQLFLAPDSAMLVESAGTAGSPDTEVQTAISSIVEIGSSSNTVK